MNIYSIFLIAASISCSILVEAGFLKDRTNQSSLEVGAGYRQDSLRWNTDVKTFGTGPKKSPVHVVSTLDWKDLNIWYIEAQAKLITCSGIYLKGAIDYGWITSGHVKDTDKMAVFEDMDDSQSRSLKRFSNTRSRSEGNVYDSKIAIGYQLRACSDRFFITPLLGYGSDGQQFKQHHLRKIFSSGESERLMGLSYYRSLDSISSSLHFDSESKEIHSTYHARWVGPFAGVDLDYYGCWGLNFFMSYEYHWVTYHGRANWKWRTDFCDGKFNHYADNGQGNVIDFGLRWMFYNHWTVALKCEFKVFFVGHGTDRMKVLEESFNGIQRNTYLEQPLKDIRWIAGSVALDLGFAF